MSAELNHHELLSVPAEAHASARVLTSTAIPLRSLASLEEGQINFESQNQEMLSAANFKKLSSKYAGLLAASALQEKDSAYLGIRAFTLPYAFLQAYLEKNVQECWEKVENTILKGDDDNVPYLMEEFKEKASACHVGLKRKRMEELTRMPARDLRVYLKYRTLEETADQQYPWDTSHWRSLRTLDRFEDWARSIFMANNSRISGWLGFLAPCDTVEIDGQQKLRIDPKRLISVLATVGGLSASFVFGTPFIILASEALTRWANIVIVVVWVSALLMFLVGWGWDPSYIFAFVLTYTTMLGSVNMGGSK